MKVMDGDACLFVRVIRKPLFRFWSYKKVNMTVCNYRFIMSRRCWCGVRGSVAWAF